MWGNGNSTPSQTENSFSNAQRNSTAGWQVTDATPFKAKATSVPRKFQSVKGAKNDEDFKEILRFASARTVITNFGAVWCDHCKMMYPEFMRLSEEFTQPLYVVTDVDAVPFTSKDIRYTPTFSFYKKGKKVDEIFGSNQQQLRDHVWLHSTPS